MALAAADLNVVAVYAVKTDLERIQPQLFTLADLQPVEVVAGAVGECAPLVQLAVVPDHAAVAYQHRRRFNDRAFQQLTQLVELAHL